MQKNKDVLFANAAANFNYEWKYPGDHRGVVHRAGVVLHRVQHERDGERDGQVKTRTYNPGTETKGWEFFTESDLPGNAERVAAEAVEHAMAKPVGPGSRT
jgi:TldD protein